MEIAADIVQAQVSTTPMNSHEIVNSLRQVFDALQGIQKLESEGMPVSQDKQIEEGPSELPASEKMDPWESIQEDKIICLECGIEMRQLTAKHLKSHNLTPRSYKGKWGFPLKQSLSAKSLSKSRSKAAKKRGLPQNLVKFQEDRKQRKEKGAHDQDERTMPAEQEEIKTGSGTSES